MLRSFQHSCSSAYSLSFRPRKEDRRPPGRTTGLIRPPGQTEGASAGDKVTIATGKEVVLDVSPPALGSLTIDGKLSFANNRDLELTTEWIMLHGELEIGTEARPHTRKATITFTNNVKDEEIVEWVGMPRDRGIMLMGGTLNLHGDRTHTWTKLASTPRQAAPRSRSWTPLAGGSVTRSSSRPRISIPGRPSGAPLPPSVAIRSRSTRSWTTCTSARSPSTWMNVAKSVC